MTAILMPHPVLRPDGTDYLAGLGFDMSLTADTQYTLDGEILVQVRFDLESRFMRSLIRGKKARITVVVKCPRTYERSVHVIDSTEATLKLPHRLYADKIYLSPHISSTEEIRSFKSSEHHAEFSGMEINLPQGAILARGNDMVLTIDALQTLSAAILLIPNNDLEKGEFRVDVEEDRIKIFMHGETYRGVAFLRKTNRSALYPSVYLAALTHAIQNITSDRDRGWEVALRKTLEKSNIRIDDKDDLRRNAYVYAQKLLKYPVNYLTERTSDSGFVDVDYDE